MVMVPLPAASSNTVPWPLAPPFVRGAEEVALPSTIRPAGGIGSVGAVEGGEGGDGAAAGGQLEHRAIVGGSAVIGRAEEVALLSRSGRPPGGSRWRR